MKYLKRMWLSHLSLRELHFPDGLCHLLCPVLDLLDPVARDELGYDEVDLGGADAHPGQRFVVVAELEVVEADHLVLEEKVLAGVLVRLSMLSVSLSLQDVQQDSSPEI